jgi:asparaginyl-tRNA synthetase
MDNAESFVKHVVGHVLQHCDSDLQFFAGFYDKQLFERLNRLVDQPFARYYYETLCTSCYICK